MDDIILWYSEDEGQSWTGVTDKPGIELVDYTDWGIPTEGYFVIPTDMLIGKNSLFAIESPGVGASNVVRFSVDPLRNRPESGGGDRIGTDRVGWNLWDALKFLFGGGGSEVDNPGGGNTGGGNSGNNTGSGNNTTATGGASLPGGNSYNKVNQTTNNEYETAVDDNASMLIEEPLVPLVDGPFDSGLPGPAAQPEIKPSGLRIFVIVGAALACAGIAAGILFRRVKLRGSVK
jgi:hypothetical protein